MELHHDPRALPAGKLITPSWGPTEGLRTVLENTSRTDALRVKCPYRYCLAEPGENCQGLRKERLSCHLERHKKAFREMMMG